MTEIKTPPIVTEDENGDKFYTFGPQHSWADIARWIAGNESDRQEMLRLLQEVHMESEGHPRMLQ
jgi:hypothetical protein